MMAGNWATVWIVFIFVVMNVSMVAEVCTAAAERDLLALTTNVFSKLRVFKKANRANGVKETTKKAIISFVVRFKSVIRTVIIVEW